MAPQPPPLPNSYWIVPGQVLAGEYPAGGSGDAAQERLQKLLAAGIDCFIDLTEPGERDGYERLLTGPGSRNAVIYIRKPIRDHGLPKSPEQMEEVLDELDSAVAGGRRVYLHCRAGIGRTNLVAGCWLAGGGLTGEAALARLNELWRQSARSQSWPTVPETEAQREYVRGWQSSRPRMAVAPRAPAATAHAPAAVRPQAPAPASADPRDRCRGLLLGLAIGDAIGQPARGQRSGAAAAGNALAGGGPLGLPAGAWSDKTAMALCLAESFTARKCMDAPDQLQRYRQWQREGRWSSTGQCVGISKATTRALATAQWTGNPFSGSHDPARADAEPLARIGPAVAFAIAHPREAIELAVACARVTHQAPLTLDAVRYFAALLAGALAGATKHELLAPHFSPVPGLWEAIKLKERVNEVAAGSWRLGKPRTKLTGAQGAARALEGTLWAFERGASPGECLGIAAGLGGDADVRAAMVGQLAGAHYGVAAMPEAWLGALARGTEIAAMADALFEADRRQ
ncbi:MAG: ADP-ribosylglycohydrolase family protein [Steroidobacteraceae bacterium]